MNEYPTDQMRGAGASAVTECAATFVGLTPLAHQYLDQTRPWVRFMSIVMFVLSGVMVLIGSVMLLVSLLGGFAPKGTESGVFGSTIVGGLMALLYIAAAVLYLAPALSLARYATAIKLLKTKCEAGVLEDAIRHQRSFFRFVGTMMAIGLSLAVVGLVLAVVVAGIAGAMAAGRA